MVSEQILRPKELANDKSLLPVHAIIQKKLLG